ncbi:MAG: PQQ-binding-like beta-propeller repeat protein, partial [Planctomycetes bacterium]|nr:PQQ-binding-like beta-propeller repeat protein [Planctomycetota bacterium]
MSATRHWLRTFAIALVAPLSLLHAADWPQWGGTASRNMVSAEKNLPETFVPGQKGTQGEGILLATTRNVKWAVRTGDFSCGTPTVAGGKVFIGGMVKRQGVMNCFDEATGRLLWQWITPCRSDLKADAMNFRHFPKSLGVCSTPVVDGDRLYFVDQNCVVVCLSIHGQTPAPGTHLGQARVIWTFDMYADKAVGSRPSDACNGSPLIDGDMLYVTTSNGVDRIVKVPIKEDAARRCFAPDAPTLIVLDKRTGRFLARDTAPTAANMLHGQWSSPSMGPVQGRKLVFLGGGDGNCYAFEALDSVPTEPVTLKTAWWVDCNPKEYRVFGGMDMIEHYTLGDRRRRDTINKPNDGSFIGMSEIIATPVFYKNRVYVAIGRDPDHGRGCGMLLCLDANQAGDSTETSKIWTYKGLDRTLSTVSISDGLLYIADVAGRLHCLNVETGQVQWIYESDSRTIASALVADGKIFLPTEKHLHILAAGNQMKLLSRISLGAPSWITPVAANGTLYIASRNYLW